MLEKLLNFIREAEYRNFKVRGPRDLPKDFMISSDLYYISSLLNHKFNKKYTTREVKELLDEMEKFLDKKGNDLIPQWYKDKYFKK